MSYLSEILADSPVGIWYLDEASGTSAADQSGNSRNGTYTGSNTKRAAQLVKSEQNAVDLTGGYIDIADSTAFRPATTGALTAEAWINVDTLPSAQMVVTKVNEFNLRLETNGSVTFFVNNTGLGAYLDLPSNPGTIATGTNYHIVAVYDQAATPKLICYVNGVSVGSTSTTNGTRNSDSQHLQIGRRSDGGGNTLDGRIGFVAVYPTGLSAARASAHYAAGLATLVSPAAVVGVGSVQAPSLIADSTAVPSQVAGSGVISAPLVPTVTPSVVPGAGTVQAPIGAATKAASTIVGVGTVQVSTPAPSGVLGRVGSTPILN